MNQENMKMTEVGWIPKDWEVKTLDEVGTFSKGRGVSRDQSHSGKLPCVRYGELYTSHENYIRAFYSFISQDVADTAKRLNKGDVLFAASGETKEEIGKTVAFVGTEEAYAGGDIIILSPKIESNSMFLGFVLNGERAVRQKSALGQGDAVVHIHAPELARVCIPFPPTQEQSRIAEVLSDTDSLIAFLSRTIKKKRLVKQGAMQQLLTGKTRLKGFCGEWVEKKLGDIAKMNSGGTPSTSNPEYYNGDIPFLSISDMTNSGRFVIKTEKSITTKGLNESSARLFPSGTILYAMYASLGKTAISKKELAVSQAILGITPNEMIDSYYLYHKLCFMQAEVVRNGQTGTQSNLSKTIVQDFDILFPKDLNEQFAIANILTTMDDEIAALEAERDKYISIKQGMMQKLLTGEIRLPICLTTE